MAVVPVGSDYVHKFEWFGLLLRIVLGGAKSWPFSTRQVLVLKVLAISISQPILYSVWFLA